MESLPNLLINQRPPRSNNVRYPRRRVQSARRWHDESPQTTTRTMESSEPDTARSLQDLFDNDDYEEEEQEEWVTKVNETANVNDAMKELFKSDPETFYLYGIDILKMIEYRFEHNLDSQNSNEST